MKQAAWHKTVRARRASVQQMNAHKHAHTNAHKLLLSAWTPKQKTNERAGKGRRRDTEEQRERCRSSSLHFVDSISSLARRRRSLLSRLVPILYASLCLISPPKWRGLTSSLPLSIRRSLGFAPTAEGKLNIHPLPLQLLRYLVDQWLRDSRGEEEEDDFSFLLSLRTFLYLEAEIKMLKEGIFERNSSLIFES